MTWEQVTVFVVGLALIALVSYVVHLGGERRQVARFDRGLERTREWPSYGSVHEFQVLASWAAAEVEIEQIAIGRAKFVLKRIKYPRLKHRLLEEIKRRKPAGIVYEFAGW